MQVKDVILMEKLQKLKARLKILLTFFEYKGEKNLYIKPKTQSSIVKIHNQEMVTYMQIQRGYSQKQNKLVSHWLETLTVP